MTAVANSKSKQPKSKKSSEIPEKALKYMETMLDCVDHDIAEACNISLVPEQLRKWKAEAYMPQVVPIGPVHRGKTNLLYMEEIKWLCMKHLFQRSELNEATCLSRCSTSMWRLDEIIRASYVEEVKFNREDLAKICTLDGCFLLEILISGSLKLSEKLPRNPDLGASAGAEVIEREEVLSDLTLLENQIPIIVLDTLSEVLFKKHYKKDECTKLIHECALSILGYNYSCSVSSSSELEAFNLVELVHSFIDKERDDEDNDSKKMNTGIPQVRDRKLKLRRCASKLQAAGVEIIGLETKNIPKNEGEEPDSTQKKQPERFDLRIKFRDGKLEIPQLHITATTEAKWRNLIAWELNRATLDKHRGSKEAKTRCQFISYAWFIQSLICCVHDVKLLRDTNVIVVHEVENDKGEKEIMKDEDLLNLFRKITDGVSKAQIEMDPWFVQEIHKLNSHITTVDLATETRRVMWHFFRCFLTWIWHIVRDSLRVLRRDYIPTGWRLIAVVGAIVGLALTAIQTAYSIIGSK